MMVLRQDKDFKKIVEFHDQMIKSLISQKARGDQSFNDQTEEMKEILSIPSNKFLDWAKNLDMFVKTVINSKINDMDLINKYKEFVKELVDYQAQNVEINQKLQEFNQDYDLFTNIVIKLENKITQMKMTDGAIEKKIKDLKDRLTDAQETISTQADHIEELESELERTSKNKNKETRKEEPVRKTMEEDEVEEDELEQAWTNILGDEPVKKKYEDEEQDNYDEDDDDNEESDEDDDESDEDEDDTMEENTNNEQEEDTSNDEDDDDHDEIKKEKDSIQEDDDISSFEIYETDNLDDETIKKFNEIKPPFYWREKQKKHYAFVKNKKGIYTLKDISSKIVIQETVDNYQFCARIMKQAIACLDVYSFDKKNPIIGDFKYYSSEREPTKLKAGYELSKETKKAIDNMENYVELVNQIKKQRHELDQQQNQD